MIGASGFAAVLLSLNRILNLGVLAGVTLLDNACLSLPCALLVVFACFAFNAIRILQEAGKFMAPKPAVANAAYRRGAPPTLRGPDACRRGGQPSVPA